jgi:hypothetical protein
VTFTFELALGDHVVKRVTIPGERGVRVLRTSGGDQIGTVSLTPRGLRVTLDDDAANTIADAQFH